MDGLTMMLSNLMKANGLDMEKMVGDFKQFAEVATELRNSVARVEAKQNQILALLQNGPSATAAIGQHNGETNETQQQ